MWLSWLFVSDPLSGPHNRCEKSESLSVSGGRWATNWAVVWLVNHVPDRQFSSAMLPSLHPLWCLPISHRLWQVLFLTQIVKEVAWWHFLLKQDQLSSRRSAGRTFIGFITTRGTVQCQHVCNPTVPTLRHVHNPSMSFIAKEKENRQRKPIHLFHCYISCFQIEEWKKCYFYTIIPVKLC